MFAPAVDPCSLGRGCSWRTPALLIALRSVGHGAIDGTTGYDIQTPEMAQRGGPERAGPPALVSVGPGGAASGDSVKRGQEPVGAGGQRAAPRGRRIGRWTQHQKSGRWRDVR